MSAGVGTLEMDHTHVTGIAINAELQLKNDLYRQWLASLAISQK